MRQYAPGSSNCRRPGQAPRARSTISTVEPYRAQVERRAAEGVGGITVHAALCRDHGYRGSYSAVRRMMAGIRSPGVSLFAVMEPPGFRHIGASPQAGRASRITAEHRYPLGHQPGAEGMTVARRRFEMFQYRQILVRLRQGDTDREIARSGLIGRRKLAAFRALCQRQGWLDPTSALPEDVQLAACVGQAKRARSTISSAEVHRELVSRWTAQGVSAVAIHAALRREHGYSGSYSAVYRLIQSLGDRPPDATVPLSFAPAEAAQVDFGAGPILTDPSAGRDRRTWCFVMTLCFSRHQYLEFVFDQTIATWLGCHRRAFEWFGRVPERLIIDNPKCAITRACIHDPIVQRSYAECAEGYGFRIDACPPADPAKKGIVEAGVKYVKGNFLPLRQFRDLSDLNAQSQHWVLQEAGLRIHGTTREQPLMRFALERPLMKPLPPLAPDLGVWAQASVHRDCPSAV